MSKLDRTSGASHSKESFFKTRGPGGGAEHLPSLLHAASLRQGRHVEVTDNEAERGVDPRITSAGTMERSAAASAARDVGGHALPDSAGYYNPPAGAAHSQQADDEESSGWSSGGEAHRPRTRPSSSHDADPTEQDHDAAPPSLQAAAARTEGPERSFDAAGDQQSDPAQRAQILASFQGMALSQIDASTLAALPWDLQRELVTRLPRNTLECQRDVAKPAAPQPVTPLAGRTGGGEEGHAPLPAECSPWVGSGVSGRVLHATHGDGGGTPIVALPSVSKLDPTVLAELPWHLRRELEVAYGRSRLNSEWGRGPLAPQLPLAVCASRARYLRRVPMLLLQIWYLIIARGLLECFRPVASEPSVSLGHPTSRPSAFKASPARRQLQTPKQA